MRRKKVKETKNELARGGEGVYREAEITPSYFSLFSPARITDPQHLIS